MRIDRKSPRSSVTCWSLLSGQRRRTASGWSSQRGLGVVGGVREPAEPGGGLGGGRSCRGAGALADASELDAELVGRCRVQLGQRVADDPGTVPVVGGGSAFGLLAEGGLGRRTVHDRQ